MGNALSGSKEHEIINALGIPSKFRVIAQMCQDLVVFMELFCLQRLEHRTKIQVSVSCNPHWAGLSVHRVHGSGNVLEEGELVGAFGGVGNLGIDHDVW